MIKKLLLMLIVLLLLCVPVFAGGKKEAEKKGNPWLEKAQLDKDIPIDQLYQAAKEEGKVVVYSLSSRVKKVKATFEEQYPGVEVEAYDIRVAEIFEKFKNEYEAGLYNVDVLFMQDLDGSIYNEFFKTGLLHKYLPADIAKNIPEEYQEICYMPYFEVKQIFYNTEVYPECPIDNWWDLTRKEYSGKLMIVDPLQNASTMGVFIAMIQNSDDMEKAYIEEFGEKLVLSDGCENAGYEFMKRIAENDPIIVTSESKSIKAIGAPGQKSAPFVMGASSKMRYAGDKVLVDVVKEIKPKNGKVDNVMLAITDKAPHVNAAKLFIRWMAGEADGTGAGYDPYRSVGTWPSRTDVKLVDTPPLDSFELWPTDLDFNYKNLEKVRNFWISLQ